MEPKLSPVSKMSRRKKIIIAAIIILLVAVLVILGILFYKKYKTRQAAQDIIKRAEYHNVQMQLLSEQIRQITKESPERTPEQQKKDDIVIQAAVKQVVQSTSSDQEISNEVKLQIANIVQQNEKAYQAWKKNN